MKRKSVDNFRSWLAILAVSTLLAGVGLTVKAEEKPPKAVRGKELTVSRQGDCMVVKQGNQTVLAYRDKNVSHKPYVAELTTPSGINVLRDAPADHLHHHGLMLAWRVNGVNFWEQTPGCGLEMGGEAGPYIYTEKGQNGTVIKESAGINHLLYWRRAAKDESPATSADPQELEKQFVLLKEERRITVVPRRTGQPRLATWESSFTTSGEPKTLTGANYHGLGARFLVAMDKEGIHLNSAGEKGVAQTNGKRANWCAYMARTGPGKPVCFAMFDHPDNPRHPACWFTLDQAFAYLSVTLGLDKEPLKVEPGKHMILRYGIALFDGQPSKKSIEEVYQKWVKARE